MPGVSCGYPPSFRQGRRPFWGGDRGSDGCQEPEPLCWGPQLIPSPGGRGPEGAGRRAGGAPRSSAHLSQSAQAQVKLRGRPSGRSTGSLAGQEGRAVHPVVGSGRLVLTEPKWCRKHARLTCFSSALVPVTPTGLGHSLRVARSFRPKYREISRSEAEYRGKGFTFLPQYSIEIRKWI